MEMEQTSLRPGMFPHHTEDCDLEFRYEYRNERAYWCHTHHQWAHEFGKRVYVFDKPPLKRKVNGRS